VTGPHGEVFTRITQQQQQQHEVPLTAGEVSSFRAHPNCSRALSRYLPIPLGLKIRMHAWNHHPRFPAPTLHNTSTAGTSGSILAVDDDVVVSGAASASGISVKAGGSLRVTAAGSLVVTPRTVRGAAGSVTPMPLQQGGLDTDGVSLLEEAHHTAAVSALIDDAEDEEALHKATQATATAWEHRTATAVRDAEPLNLFTRLHAGQVREYPSAEEMAESASQRAAGSAERRRVEYLWTSMMAAFLSTLGLLLALLGHVEARGLGPHGETADNGPLVYRPRQPEQPEQPEQREAPPPLPRQEEELEAPTAEEVPDVPAAVVVAAEAPPAARLEDPCEEGPSTACSEGGSGSGLEDGSEEWIDTGMNPDIDSTEEDREEEEEEEEWMMLDAE